MNDGYDILITAIVQQSVVDYIKALIEIRKNGYVQSDSLYLNGIISKKNFKIKEECESFFSSTMFELYSGSDVDIFKRKCKEFAEKHDSFVCPISIVKGSDIYEK